VAVVGTGTGVGKTWVAARTLAELRASGVTVAARKPVQSYEPAELGATDAEVLAAATGEDPAAVCPRMWWLPVPMAPPMAAAVLGRPAPRLDELLDAVAWPAGTAVGVVETVGGVRSPLADDGDSADVVARLDPDLVLLVADAALGTLNLVRLSVAALGGRPLVVVLNRFDAADDLHRRNRDWLVERDGLRVVVGPQEAAAALSSGVPRR